VPKDIPYPYYSAEIIGQIPDPSKTMWKNAIKLSFMRLLMVQMAQLLYSNIDKLAEAMTMAIELPAGYELIMQTPTGVQQIYDEARRVEARHHGL
jgi:hypothetical protein